LEYENAKLTERIQQFTAEREKLTSNNIQLQAKVFSIDRFIKSDKDLSFYTGFPNGNVLESVLRYLDPGKEGESINYWHSPSHDSTNVNQRRQEDAPKQGRPRQ